MKVPLGDGSHGGFGERRPLLRQVPFLVEAANADSWDSPAVAGLGCWVGRRGRLLALVEGRCTIDTHRKVVVAFARFIFSGIIVSG